MKPEDLLTVATFLDFKQELKELLEELRPALVNAMDRYLNIEEVAAFTNHHENTVRSWIKMGKKDRFNKVYKLEAEEFAPNQYRMLRSKVVEFGKIKDCTAVVPARKNKAA